MLEISDYTLQLFKHKLMLHLQENNDRLLNVSLTWLQTNGEGPKRIPVPHQPLMTQKSVVTPTPHQRVLGVSNGPQRIQRPVSHQKPVSHVSFAVKSTQPSDQNVNPATPKGNPAPHPKPVSLQTITKTNVPNMNPESVKPPSDSEKLGKPQSKSV